LSLSRLKPDSVSREKLNWLLVCYLTVSPCSTFLMICEQS
jgi:hypothetical protein